MRVVSKEKQRSERSQIFYFNSNYLNSLNYLNYLNYLNSQRLIQSAMEC